MNKKITKDELCDICELEPTSVSVHGVNGNDIYTYYLCSTCNTKIKRGKYNTKVKLQSKRIVK